MHEESRILVYIKYFILYMRYIFQNRIIYNFEYHIYFDICTDLCCIFYTFAF